jgi:hypothetical protein
MPFGGSRLRRFPDAPLAHLNGTPAKQAKEIGAPSLKHPFARVFTAVVATSPLANSKWRHAVPCLHFRVAPHPAKRVDQFHLRDCVARDFKEPWACKKHSQASRSTDRDVEPIATVEKLDLAWQVVARRCRHRNEDGGRLLSLKFIDGADSRTLKGETTRMSSCVTSRLTPSLSIQRLARSWL